MVDNIDWFKTHLCVVSVTGVGNNGISYNGNSNICINGNGIGNKLKEMTGNDNEFGAQLNRSGMNLVWNFPDATGELKVTALSGHLVAPKAAVTTDNSNYEGGIIAKSLSVNAEGHFYPMSRTLASGTSTSGGGEETTTTEDTNNQSGTEKATTGTLVVVVQDEKTGEPVPGAVVAIIVPGGDKRTDTTDTEGKITIENLPAGKYSIEITEAPEGYNVTAGEAATKEVTAGGTATHVIKIAADSAASDNSGDQSGTEEATGTLTVVVQDEKTGEPVPGAVVTITDPDGGTTEHKTDTEGKITIENLPEGEYKIVIKEAPEGYEVTAGETITAEVKAGETSTHVISLAADSAASDDSGDDSDDNSGGKSVTGKDSGDTPVTGDDSAVFPVAVLLILSAGAAVYVGRRKKKL